MRWHFEGAALLAQLHQLKFVPTGIAKSMRIPSQLSFSTVLSGVGDRSLDRRTLNHALLQPPLRPLRRQPGTNHSKKYQALLDPQVLHVPPCAKTNAGYLPPNNTSPTATSLQSCQVRLHPTPGATLLTELRPAPAAPVPQASCMASTEAGPMAPRSSRGRACELAAWAAAKQGAHS